FILSDTQITATTAAAPTGTVDVRVLTPWAGSSATGVADRFTYVGSPIRSLAGPGFTLLSATHDRSFGPIPLNFTPNFFGNTYSSIYINNNGNITFTGALPDFTPFDLTTTTTPIIAPFFADVDTRIGSIASAGSSMVDGHPAFYVDWFNVGYHNERVDP